jgi:hypothetical protein
MHPFRDAVERADLAAVADLLDDDIVFHSPVAFKPYEGKQLVGGILAAVITVFQDFTYVNEIGAEGASDRALVFTARVGDKQLEGVDFLHTNEAGLIDRFTVMVRPLSAAQALAEEMAIKFAELQAAMQEAS